MSALQDASSNPRWNLVADIGGTNARFSAVLEGQLESEHEFHHSVEEYPEFAGLIGGLLAEIAEATGWNNPPVNACFAVACPADTEVIAFTNSHWKFTKTSLQQALGCENLAVINDFEAVAHGIVELDEADLVQVGGQLPVAHKAIGILGALVRVLVLPDWCSTQMVIMCWIPRAVMRTMRRSMSFRVPW